MTEREWVRLLAWYPREWRERNGAAMAGVLMDAAEGSGRTRPTASDRFSLILGGMRERLVRRERNSMLSLGALVAGSAYSVAYLVTVAWSPGVGVAGSVGPFTNSSFVTAILLSVALAFAIVRRAGAARLFAWLAVASALTIWLLATTLHWFGPGPNATALFVGFALLGASRTRGVLRAIGLIAALVLTSFALAFASIASASWVGVFPSPPAIGFLTAATVAGASALLVLALALAGSRTETIMAQPR